MLSIEVTTKCNLRCINCFAHDSSHVFEHLGLKKAEEIALEGRVLGYKSISLTGGETFLWPYILGFLTYLKSIGYETILINSNLHLLTEELCNKLSKFTDLLTISCSINGFKDEHEIVRGIGSYDKVITGLKNAITYGLKMIVYTVVNRRNLYDIPKFTEWLFKQFPEIIDLVFIQLRGIDDGYYQVEDLKLEPKDLIEFVKMISYLSLGGYNVSILENSLSTVVAEMLGFKWYPKSPEISRDGKIVVMQTGVITDNHSSLEILGNYNNQSLKDVLESKEYRELCVDESKLCIGCKFISICRKSGKVRPSDMYHNTGDSDYYYCQKVLSQITQGVINE
ncbi:MAG: radical SAM protein [Spirochaetaceae bacterium]